MDEPVDYPDYGAATDPKYDGHEHDWPAELTPEARCTVCGLEYADWSEVL